MSKSPIFNDITVYGTYMNPETGFLQTRIPVPDHGFEPISFAKLSEDQKLDFVVFVKAKSPSHVAFTNTVMLTSTYLISSASQH